MLEIPTKEDVMSTDTLIADRIEIADLLTRFARLLDEERWEDADTVFTDDVAVRSPRGGELHGIDACRSAGLHSEPGATPRGSIQGHPPFHPLHFA